MAPTSLLPPLVLLTWSAAAEAFSPAGVSPPSFRNNLNAPLSSRGSHFSSGWHVHPTCATAIRGGSLPGFAPLFASDGPNEASSANGDSDAEVSSDTVVADKDPVSDFERLSGLFRAFLDMAIPYYKESKAGRWLFAGMVGLTLLNSGVSVAFSYVGKDFWNALSSKDVEEFYRMLTKYAAALVCGMPVTVLYRFQRERLANAWREWLTDRTFQLYQSNRVYYALERGREIDNPDQRISEDVRSFTAFSLQLFITLVTSVIDLVSFSFILYSIQPQLFGAIVAYATFGTLVTAALGRKLVGLNYEKLQREADFRYSLVRVRENAESIAFYSGEDIEGKEVTNRLEKVIDTKGKIIFAERNVDFFTTSYRYFIQILPVWVVAPQFFSGAIQLGVVSQSVGAFNHILNDLSVIINQFEALSSFSAAIDRLSQFMEAIRDADEGRTNKDDLLKLPPNVTDSASASSEMSMMLGVDGANGSFAEDIQPKIQMMQMAPLADLDSPLASDGTSRPILSAKNLTLVTPDRKRTLVSGLDLSIKEGENLLIVGNSGAGKSSLLRAIAGLWTAGDGMVERPCDQDVYFLPQRPYCALGSLKDQLLYPSIEDADPDDYPEGHRLSRAHLLRNAFTDDDLLTVLEAVDLGELAARAGDGDPYNGLDAVLDWSNTLSLGEQQRLAFGRVLVNRPRLLILDEATSALDMVAEAKMYTLIREMGRRDLNGKNGLTRPALTFVSVGHRPSLLAYHDTRLRLGGKDGHSVEAIDKSNTSTSPSSVTNL